MKWLQPGRQLVLKRSVILASILILVFLLLPIFLPVGWTSLVVEIFIMAVAASAANFMAGYAGLVSFGLAGFYGAGAYITALLITKLGAPFFIAFFAGPVGAALLSVIVGWLCVRRTAVYFSMLTLAFSQLMYTVVYIWYGFTGGDNGIVGIKIPHWLAQTVNYYYFTFGALLLCLLAMWKVVNSPLGKTLQALRENPDRANFIGVNVRLYQLVGFVIGNFFLGVAGSLYCGFNQNVFPNYLFWTKTFEIMIVYLLGGIYNFMGPAFGSVVYILANNIITGWTEYWPLMLGTFIVILTLFLPQGIGGFLSRRFFDLAGLWGFRRLPDRRSEREIER